MTFGNGGNVPDVNGRGSLYGGAGSIVVVWAIGLFGVAVPPEVASAITLLAAGAIGVLVGDTRGARAQDRRADDTKAGA